jgi:tetratricopeptide (TPR) repeat protein
MMRGTTRGTAGGLAVIVAVAVATSFVVSRKMRGEEGRLRGLLATEIDRGSLVGLGRAQAIGRRVVISDPDDAEAAALLGFASALLATEFGQATIHEAESAVSRVDRAHSGADSEAVVIAGAVRALVDLRKGEPARALAEATLAAAVTGAGPYAHCALGRVRAAAGDLAGASRALEAAMVEAPGFLPARLAWAEVRLDLGDASAASAMLAPIVKGAPEDARARFFLAEAAEDLAADPRLPRPAEMPSASLDFCDRNGPIPPYVASGCALSAAGRARREGDRLRASTQAQTAGRTAPDEPRLLARAAQLLAQEGFVDRADKLLERASRFAAAAAPQIAWARLAVTLGHGRAATAPPGLRPADATTRVIAARAAFAVGGAGALAATLDAFGPTVVEGDADLRLLRTLVKPPPGGAAPGAKRSAAEHYVEGVRARLVGNMLSASEHLSHALSGHADACRAAGEYIATLRAFKQRPDPAAFDALRAENAGCVNLPAR